MTHPAAAPTALTPPFAFLKVAHIDYAALSFRAIRLGTLAMALCCLAIMFNPDLQMGLLRMIQLDLRILPQIEDMSQRRIILSGLGAGLFLADVFQRTGRPYRWTHLTSLSGFGVGAAFTLLYTIEGKTSAIGLALYGGAFVLSLGTMASIIQRHTPLKRLAWIEGNLTRGMASIFAVLAFGLWTQPDSAITEFIQTRYGWLILAPILGLLIWGHAQLRHNHLPVWDSFRRISGFFLFALLMLYFLAYDPSASLLGVTLTVYLFVLMILTVWFQAQRPPSQEAGL